MVNLALANILIYIKKLCPLHSRDIIEMYSRASYKVMKVKFYMRHLVPLDPNRVYIVFSI